MTRFPGCALVVLVLLAAPAALAQTPPIPPPGARPAPTGPPGAPRPGMPPRDPGGMQRTGTARLSGRVVALETAAPLRRASVSIFGAESQYRRVTTTDAEGRYEFADLPSGRFSVNATKSGYVALQFGQRRPYEGGTPIVLAEGQAVERVDLALPRGSVIAGRVTDEFGEPMASAQVQVQRQQYLPDGQRRLAPAGTDLTNDLGEFRVFGLMPGEYIVSAGVRGTLAVNVTVGATDVNEGYPPTYYPGTLNPAEAQMVSVGTGQETAVHLSLLPARMMRVSGIVVDSQGRPVPSATVMLRSPSGIGFTLMSAGMVGADGAFAVMNVPPGEHVLDVRPQPRAGEPAEAASVPITVASGDITGLRIVTGRGAVLSGRVVFDGSSAKSPLQGLPAARVMAGQADLSGGPLPGTIDPQMNGTIADDGSFELAGPTGRVLLSVAMGAPWSVRSVTLDGVDVTDVPIDLTGRSAVSNIRIVMTDKQTAVGGQVADPAGRRLTDYVVVILSAEPKEGIAGARYIRLVRPDTDGRFETRGLRPGRYIAAAVEALEQGQQFAPEVQARLRSAGRAFEIEEGGRVTLALELARGF